MEITGMTKISVYLEHLGWRIEKNLKPIPDRRHDYDFWHDEYDGDNGLSGTAGTYGGAVEQIFEIEKTRE